jgi:Flp pilus assembly protein TadD
MNRIANKRMIGLAVSTAMAAGLLNGCVTNAAPRADLSASRAEAALAKGKTERAIENAEAATLAEPRNAAYRVMLGSAYLDAGRFASAATTFDDAMKLGDSSARTVLSLALALDGEGRYQEAAALLHAHESQIAPADLGLAYALSAEPGQGIQILSNAIRGGENTPKMRQNLAYGYALAGRWKEARLMAAQDEPANLVGDRMEEWSRMARPQAWQARVAALLGAPAGVVDAGQPVQLALANNPGVDQLASEATADAAPEAQLALNAPAATQELPAAEDAVPQLAVAPAPAPKAEEPSTFQAAFASVAEAAQDALRFVSQPVVQALPARHEPKPRVTKAVAVEQTNGTPLVQLGSFASEQSARRAWSIYAKRYPSLAGHRMVITEAVVRGKHYWRVSAAGFGPVTSQAMCGRVESGGEGCFAYAEGRPLPGAIESGTRLALR